MTREPLYDAEGNLRRMPTREDIRTIGAGDVIVDAAITQAAIHGGTWEDGLMLAIAMLSKRGQRLIDEVCQLHARQAFAVPPTPRQDEGWMYPTAPGPSGGER